MTGSATKARAPHPVDAHGAERETFDTASAPRGANRISSSPSTSTDIQTASHGAKRPSASIGVRNVNATSLAHRPVDLRAGDDPDPPTGDDVAQHVRAGSQRHRTADVHDRAAHLPGDLDPPVDHDDVASDEAGDHDGPAQHDDLADLVATANEHVAREHDLIPRLLRWQLELRPGRSGPGPQHQGREREGEHRAGTRHHRMLPTP